jgi:hypothetical protein
LNDPAYARLAQHGEVDRILTEIRSAAARGSQPPNAAAQALGAEFSHSVLCPRLVKIIAEAAN